MEDLRIDDPVKSLEVKETYFMGQVVRSMISRGRLKERSPSPSLGRLKNEKITKSQLIRLGVLETKSCGQATA